MSFHLRPFESGFGAEVLGLDLSRPVSEAAFAAVHAALLDHGFLLLSGQRLEPAHILDWSRRFGPLETHVEGSFLLPGYREIVVIGNLMVDGQMRSLFVNGGEEWHYDYSYAPDPSIAALFYAVEVPPEGGDTLFADTRAAYDALDPDLKARVEDLVGVYAYANLDQHLRTMDPSRPPLTADVLDAWPPVRHPIVARHPETGRKVLRLSPQVMSGIEGLAEDEGRALIARLSEHATQPRFVHRHAWQAGELLIFDNRALLHSATWFDAERYRRIMYRTTIMQAC